MRYQPAPTTSTVVLFTLAQGCINAEVVVLHRHINWLACQECAYDGVRVYVHYMRVCVALRFSWWVASLSRTSWPAVQGTMVASDPQPVGDLGRWRHSHKSMDTEHVEAFRRQTHHLLPAGTLPPSLPSSTAAPLLSVKCKLFPWK